MKKDLSKNIRINSDILKALDKSGWSVQSLLDWAIDQKLKIETKVTVKRV